MYPQSLVCLACFPEIPFWKVIPVVHWDWLFESVEELSEDDELLTSQVTAMIDSEMEDGSFAPGGYLSV